MADVAGVPGDASLQLPPPKPGRGRFASMVDPRTWSTVRRFFLLLCVVFIAKQGVTAFIFPPFSGHDEVAHFNYIATVATEHRVPELPGGVDVQNGDDLPDYFYRYCQFILDWSPCEPDNPRWLEKPFRYADWGVKGIHPAGKQYAANHPPLYYLMMAPLYSLTDSASPETQQYLFRLAAIPFGLLAVVAAYLLARTLFPAEPFLAITVPAFVAFQTQVSYESSMVNNDIAAIAFGSCTLLMLARGIRDRFTARQTVLTGFFFGLTILSKSSGLSLALVIAFAVIAALGIRNIIGWLTTGTFIVAITALMVAPWYGWLYRTYGNLTALPQISELQSAWNKPAGSFFGLLLNPTFVWRRWQESWGAFGWRRIPLDDGLYAIVLAACAVSLLGLGLLGFRWLRSRLQRGVGDEGTWASFPIQRWQAIGLVTMLLACVVSYLAVIQFGTEFALTQARYYFHVVVAFSLVVMVGIRAVTPARAQRHVQAGVVIGLFLLTFVIYTQYVIPYWYLTDWASQ